MLPPGTREHGCPDQRPRGKFPTQWGTALSKTRRQWQTDFGSRPDQQPTRQLQLWRWRVAPAPGNGAGLNPGLVGTNWLGTNSFANNGAGSVCSPDLTPAGTISGRGASVKQTAVLGLYNTLVSDESGNVTVAGASCAARLTWAEQISQQLPGDQASWFNTTRTAPVRWAQVLPEFST